MTTTTSTPTTTRPGRRAARLRRFWPRLTSITAAFGLATTLVAVPQFPGGFGTAAPAPRPVPPSIAHAGFTPVAAPAPPAGARAATGGSAGSRALQSPEQAVASGVAIVGVTWPHGQLRPGNAVEYRSFANGVWSPWQVAEVDPDGPAADSAEATGARDGTGALALLGATKVQARVVGLQTGQRFTPEISVVDPGSSPADASIGAPAPGAAVAAAAQPAIYTRAQWGADETMRDKKDLTYGQVQLAIVHHTVNANDYTPDQVPALIRGMYAYHTNPTWGRGWSDIGYNFLVDRFGRTWEGRYGGITQAVQGAHAYSNNQWSMGVSVIGTFDTTAPNSAILDAISRVIAWKFTIHGVPATGPVNLHSAGPYVSRIIGHRDAYDNNTGCPGNLLWPQLPTIRAKVAAYEGALPGAVLVPRPADGTITVNGHGSGSGKGLSQWGAYAMAEAGKTWQDIVGHYYPGAVATTADRTVRVSLTRFGTGTQTYTLTPALAYRSSGSTTWTALPDGPGQLQVIPTAAGTVTVATRAGTSGTWTALATGVRTPLRLRDATGAPIAIVSGGTDWPFRGDLVLTATAAGRQAQVNQTSADQVTAGTVANVMPAAWPAAALAAQAVAVRTYAVRQVVQTEGLGSDDTCDGCLGYTGVRGETPATVAAVAATARYLLTNEGVPALTAYSRSNGGMRASGGYSPFSLAFPDTWDVARTASATPVMSNPTNWTTTLTVAAIQSAYPSVGTLSSVTILGRIGGGDWGGRATSLRLIGSAGTRIVTADVFAAALRLPSTWFTMVPEGTLTGFVDVPPGAPFATEIAWLAARGISTGWSDGTFRPSEPVTREAMAAFMYRLAGKPAFTPPARSPFTDVPTTSAFYKEITWLAARGISTGWSDRTFRPTTSISREAMSAFMYRFAGRPAFTAPAVSPFRDVPTTGAFYREISWLAARKISTGWSDGTFRPLSPVTREAMAAFMYRLAGVMGL